jgi:hypothetical protein
MPVVRIDAGTDLGSSRDHVVEQQGLGEGERLGAVQVGPDRELPEPVGAEVARVLHPRPDGVLELAGELGVRVARDPEERLVFAVDQGRAVPVG